MTETNVPEALVGDVVNVLVGEDLDVFDGPLLEVNNRGVVIRFLQNLEELEEREAAGESVEDLRQQMRYVHYFFPWQHVRAIGRLEEQPEQPLG